MDYVKVGVIGVGRMGQRHCRVYANLRRAQLAGVCDANPQLGQQIAAQYGVPYYADVDELLTHVDAVSIVTPTPLHFDVAMRCLQKGVHVLIEKPIAATLAEAERLTQTAESSGLITMVGHIERFNAAYMELKNVLDGMKPLTVSFRRLSAFAGSNTDVDVVLDLMIHDANLVLDLIGAEPAWVEAHGLSVVSDTIDHAVVSLGFTTGPIVTLTASRITEHKVRSIDVTAREAYVECDLLNKSIFVYRETIGEYLNQNNKGVKYRQESVVERIQVPIFEPMFLELQHFVECVIEKKPPLVTARDGLNALALAERIQQLILSQLGRSLEPAVNGHHQ
ncbi:MAG: Gfo/Idh/MocA family oxidoreductase [Anaerolineales bacterium]